MALENGIRELSNAQLRQPAGQRFEYANENYNALGLIVQAVFRLRCRPASVHARKADVISHLGVLPADDALEGE